MHPIQLLSFVRTVHVYFTPQIHKNNKNELSYMITGGKDMIIHVTAAGDTITSIADRYGVETDNLLADNGLNAGDPLVVG